MSNYNTLKTTIDDNIKQNGKQEIKGQTLNSVLNQMVTTLGAGYQFAGVATLDPATDPGTPDAKVFYIANGKGTYTNFGGIEVTEDDVVILYYDTTWHKVVTGIASQAKLSELSQELLELKERVAALESGGSVPGETKYTISASATNGSVVATVNGQSVDLPYRASKNEVVKLEVLADSGYQFAQWSDGITENPREITVVADVVYSAVCEISAKTYTLRATADNGSIVAKVNGSAVTLPYTAPVNTEVELNVQPIEGYEFTEWSNASNDNPRIVRMTTDKRMNASCELAGNIPADYRILRGMYSDANNSYLDTGAAIDSHSNWDLYFGRSKYINNNNVLFGIRRASGTSDTRANAFYHKSATSWSSVAWVYGGTDTGAINASGWGVKFFGNKHKLSQRGNDLYEWNRLICHIEKDFNNEDGVTAFFGNLAKAKNTPYSTAVSGTAIFYRFVLYGENETIVKDLRPVQRVGDGVFGAYDIISGEFIPCVGTWSEWSQDSASLRIVGQVNHSPQITSASTQSASYYMGYFVTTQDGQQDFIVQGGEITTDGTTINNPARQLLQCSEYNRNWHGNTAWFGADKWDASDYFPLLYVGTDKGAQLLCVYRLIGANPDALEGVELVQKIYTPRDTPWYFNNYYGMAGANTFVHTGYTQNSYSLPDNGNTIMARVFRLPDPHIGDVTLSETDALVEVDLGFQSTTGDGYWTGKYLAITFSNPHSNPKVGKFVIWEINNSNDTPITPAYVIDGLHTGDSDAFLTGTELEGFKYNPFDDMFSLCLEPTNSGRTNLVYYKPYSVYTETKQW